MKTILTVFVGILALIGLVALDGGFLYAQPQPSPAIGPGQALIPGKTAGAFMKIRISQQCTEQDPPSNVGSAYTYKTETWRFSEKDVINLLSSGKCTSSGAFPSDLTKAGLYYRYDGSAYRVFVSSNTSDIANTAEITPACISLIFPTHEFATWAGTENLDAGINQRKVSGLYEIEVKLSIPPSAAMEGLVFQFVGTAKENLNLPKLNRKGKQTLTDSIDFSGESPGYGVPKNFDNDPSTCTPDTCYTEHCSGTVRAKGTISN